MSELREALTKLRTSVGALLDMVEYQRATVEPNSYLDGYLAGRADTYDYMQKAMQLLELRAAEDERRAEFKPLEHFIPMTPNDEEYA